MKKHVAIFIVVFSFTQCKGNYIQADQLKTDTSKEQELGNVIFSQAAKILLSFGKVTSKPNDPDVAENLIKDIIAGAFTVGKQIAQEDRKKRRHTRSANYQSEDVLDYLTSKQKQQLIELTKQVSK